MKVDLKESKETSKSESSWKSSKESKQGDDIYKGWNIYKTLIFLEEVKIEARGASALTTWACSRTWPKTKLYPRWCGKGETKTRGLLRKGASAKRFWMGKKTTMQTYAQKTVPPKTPPNHMLKITIGAP
jgi:hypothetical protein